MAAKGLVRVGVSITTLDNKTSRAMDPRVPLPARRLQTIRRLTDAGIPVRVMVSPIVPALTDHELEAILTAAHAAGAVAASSIVLRLPLEVSGLFQGWLAKAYPGRAVRVIGHVRELHGGKDYDPEFGTRMRGQGKWADLIHQRSRLTCRKLGLSRNLPPLRTDLFVVPPHAGDQMSLF
jgi:DNA repair photolyase